MRKINLVRKCGWLLGCFLVAAGMTACTDDENKVEDLVPGEGFAEEITLLPSKGSQVVKFTANSNWTAKSSEAWLKLDGEALTSGKAGAVEMYVAFDTNELVTDRKADITVSAGSTLKTIKVTQKAAGRVIAFDGVAGDTLKLEKDFSTGDVSILANVTWEFVADSLTADVKEWLKVTPGDGKVAIEILNQDGLARTARLVFRDKNFTSFTKALFVAVGGWGEEYLTWSLAKTQFAKEGDTTKLSITNVADVKPMALSVDSAGNVEAVKADWVKFAIVPASKTVVKEQKVVMTVDPSDIAKTRLAYIFVVPSDMTLEEIVAKKDELNGVKITQFAALPQAKVVKFERQKKNPDTPWEPIPDAGETSVTWSSYFDMLTMTIYNGPFLYETNRYNVRMIFETNCNIANMREVAADADGEIAYEGEEMKVVTDSDGVFSNFVKMSDTEWNFWPTSTSGSAAARTTFLVWDLLDEDGAVVSFISYKLIDNGFSM